MHPWQMATQGLSKTYDEKESITEAVHSTAKHILL